MVDPLQHNTEITEILYKYLCDETLTAEEQSQIDHWLAESEYNKQVFEEMTVEHSLKQGLVQLYTFDRSGLWKKLQEKITLTGVPATVQSAKTFENREPRAADIQSTVITPIEYTSQVHRIHFLKTAWFRYAAAIIIIMAGIGAWLLTSTKKQTLVVQNKIPAPVQNDVLPGSDKAILTLSNGQKIGLTAAGQQTITDGNLAIENRNGVLHYAESDDVLYNTMSTPKGGQYRLALPDGTNVWLNAASSITYPTSFPGKERIVSITGEAYFEVTKNPAKPFIVKTFKDEIIVLGTHFNINAYSDEPLMKTSLLEGTVRINNQILHPGQAFANGKIIQTNIEQDLAWKNGFFNFDQADIQTVMRQLSRWYNIDVQFEGTIRSRKFWGEIRRDIRLSDLLDGLKSSDIHFKIEGNRLTVMP